MKRIATALALAMVFNISAQAARPLAGPKIRVTATRNHTPAVRERSAVSHHK